MLLCNSNDIILYTIEIIINKRYLQRLLISNSLSVCTVLVYNEAFYSWTISVCFDRRWSVGIYNLRLHTLSSAPCKIIHPSSTQGKFISFTYLLGVFYKLNFWFILMIFYFSFFYFYFYFLLLYRRDTTWVITSEFMRKDLELLQHFGTGCLGHCLQIKSNIENLKYVYAGLCWVQF